MTEQIKTEGLKGVINRAIVFSNTIEQDVFDVSAHIDVPFFFFRLATNRVMLYARTSKLQKTGQDMSIPEFINVLDEKLTKISSQEELNQIKRTYKPEYNTGTNKIGEGYRGIANKVMLTARAGFHTKNGHDFMLYQYIEMLVGNSAILEEI